jgi:hypothetical protein
MTALPAASDATHDDSKILREAATLMRHSWDSGIALTVADWLEYTANILDVSSPGMVGSALDYALAVARAYLCGVEDGVR